MKIVVVTRYPAIVQHLYRQGVIDDSVTVLPIVKREDIEGCHVIGVLPVHLAAHAESVTIQHIFPPRVFDWSKLTLEDVEMYSRAPVTYQVRRVDTPLPF